MQVILGLVLLIFSMSIKSLVAVLAFYSVLPIINKIHAGVTSVPNELRDIGQVFALSTMTRLRKIELPFMLPVLLIGIRATLIISITGTATVFGMINGVGYGAELLAGLRLGDVDLILESVIPPIILALAAQLVLTIFVRVATPRNFVWPV